MHHDATAGHDRARGPICCCGLARLTSRETTLLPLLAEGKTNGQIARDLHLSAATVAHEVQQLMHKMTASCRTELVARAFASGLLTSEVWPPSSSGRRCVQVLNGAASRTARH